MKKTLGFLLILCVLITSMASVVYAENLDVVIPENDGKGTFIVGGTDDLASAVKNCSNTENSSGNNKNWSVVSIADITDDNFDKAIRIESKGTTAAPGTNQVRAMFSTDGIEAGEYVYVSFYVRILSELNGTPYDTMPPSFSVPEIGKNSGRTTPYTQSSAYISVDSYDTWEKVSYIYPISAEVASGNTYLQFGFTKPSAGLPAYALEIADLKIITFGKATGPASELISLEIKNVLDNAEFSSVKFDGDEIDLSIYPDEYTQSIYWNGTLPVISGKDTNGNDVKVEYAGAGVPQTVKLTAYATDFNKVDSTDTRKAEYLVNIDYYRASTYVDVDGVEKTNLAGCTGNEIITFKPTIYNPNGEEADYIAVLGIYKDKKCISAIPWKISVDSTDASKTGTFTYTLPTQDYTGCEIKAFVISPVKMFKVN